MGVVVDPAQHAGVLMSMSSTACALLLRALQLPPAVLKGILTLQVRPLFVVERGRQHNISMQLLHGRVH